MTTTDGTIPLARPDIGDGEKEAVGEVLESGRLVCGPRVQAFEQAVSRRIGVPHAVAFSSGTTALWALLRCLDVGPGDEVIVPAFTFPATIEAVLLNGARPVLADVTVGTLNIDPHDVATRLTSATRLVLAVDQFGLPADYPALEDVVGRRSATLVTDSACSLGSVLDGRCCGAFGEAAVFSFHPRKIITTGEGGMVVTGHAGIAGELRRLRSHGTDADGSFVQPGLNLRMGEMAGALGGVQMERLDGFVRRRRELAAAYRELLPRTVAMQHVAPTAEPNYQTLAVIMDDGATSADRDALIDALRRQGIEATVASYCLPLLPAYAAFAQDVGAFPEALAAHERGLALPMYVSMSDDDVARVCSALR